MKPVDLEVVRELTQEDLDNLLSEEGKKVTSLPSARQRLRSRHHALARLIAEGVSHTEAAVVMGMDRTTVSILSKDQTFAELVKHYEADVHAEYLGMHTRLAGLAEDALETLRDRLEDEPEKIPNDTLLDMVKLGADRTGHGPQSTTNHNVNVGIADRLAEARKRIREAREMKTIEHDAEDAA